MNILLNRPNAYSKMEKEDPEEMQQRRAQFLIYKALKEADHSMSQRKQPIWLKMKVCKLKIKIGRNITRMRKSIVLKLSATKGRVVCKKFICQLKSWKCLIKGRETMVRLPTMFT